MDESTVRRIGEGTGGMGTKKEGKDEGSRANTLDLWDSSLSQLPSLSRVGAHGRYLETEAWLCSKQMSWLSQRGTQGVRRWPTSPAMNSNTFLAAAAFPFHFSFWSLPYSLWGGAIHMPGWVWSDVNTSLRSPPRPAPAGENLDTFHAEIQEWKRCKPSISFTDIFLILPCSLGGAGLGSIVVYVELRALSSTCQVSEDVTAILRVICCGTCWRSLVDEETTILISSACRSNYLSVQSSLPLPWLEGPGRW